MPPEETLSLKEHLSEQWDKMSDEGNLEQDHSLAPITDDDPVKDIKSLQSEDEIIDQPLDEGQEQQEVKEPPAKPVKAPKAVKGLKGTVVAAAPAPATKAPGSWKPELREHWGKIPLEVQGEITRRESEVNRAMGQATAARQFAEEFQKTVAPFESLVRSSGVTSLQAVNNLMSTAAALQTGTPAQKARTAANILKAYAVDIGILDQILAGEQPKEGAGNPSPDFLNALDQRLKPVTEFMSTFQQKQQSDQQQLMQDAQSRIDAFAVDPKHEFYEDLREDMADILDMATKRGRKMTMDEAYDVAARANPEVSKLYTKRIQQQTTMERAAALQKSRRAASSLSGGTPASLGGTPPKPKGSRAAVAQAFDDLSAAE